MIFIFILDIYVMPITTKQFIYEIKSPIILRGDIFVHFFQIHNKSRQTELISSIQFHTCAISRNEIEFYKNDISFPHSGKKFTWFFNPWILILIKNSWKWFYVTLRWEFLIFFVILKTSLKSLLISVKTSCN